MQTVYKTTTYAFVHVFVAFAVAWLVSGSLAVALGISLIEPAIQVGFYYMHEKIWHKFGKQPVDHHVAENISCIAPCCAPTILNKLKKLGKKDKTTDNSEKAA